ncbi:MAG: response regulator [Trueperaceae bacterium]|nr:response regulator [Trueperaceae bacterium]
MADISFFNQAKLLIVDDEQVNLILLERILRDCGFQNMLTAQSAEEAQDLLDSSFDLVITDHRMKKITGLEFIKFIRETLGDDLPVLLASSELSLDLEQTALDLGANDFLPKPFRAPRVRARVTNSLRHRQVRQQLNSQIAQFDLELRKRTKALQQAHLEALERLALAAEYRDYMTGRHTHRVGLLSARIAGELGLPEIEIDLIRRAAPLHDVGKIGIPDSILLKPGKLTSQEYEVMKTHVQLGLKLLSPNTSRLVRMAKLIALTHHERWDGSGYPRGLIGQDIPLVGQIVAIADVYDALVSKRPYKHAWKTDEAIDEIKTYRGTWFAPEVVDAFLTVADFNDSSTSAIQS